MVEVSKAARQDQRARRDAEERPSTVSVRVLPEPAPAPKPEKTPSCAPLLAQIPNANEPRPAPAPPGDLDGTAVQDLEEESRHQQIAGLIATGKAPVVGNLAVASLTVALLWGGAIGDVVLAGWLAGLTGILAVRYFAFREPPDAASNSSKRWLSLFAGSSALTGACGAC